MVNEFIPKKGMQRALYARGKKIWQLVRERERVLHAFEKRKKKCMRGGYVTSLSGEARLIALGITWWQQPGEH